MVGDATGAEVVTLLTWFWCLGCIGITLIITSGKVFAPLRKFLLSFKNGINPMKWLGLLLSCPMCTGWWVGFLWSYFFLGAQLLGAVLVGGLISLMAYAADEVLLGFEKLFGERK